MTTKVLTGTEKQINWAASIRNAAAEELAAARNAGANAAAIDMVAAHLGSITSAAQWISIRGSVQTPVAMAMYVANAAVAAGRTYAEQVAADAAAEKAKAISTQLAQISAEEERINKNGALWGPGVAAAKLEKLADQRRRLNAGIVRL